MAIFEPHLNTRGSGFETYLGINKAEWHAVLIENSVRFEAGIPLRAYYGKTVDGQGSGTNMLLVLFISQGLFDNDALLSFYNYDSLGHDNVCPRYYPSWL